MLSIHKRHEIQSDLLWRNWTHLAGSRDSFGGRAALIYALVDPRDERPFYVGCSISPESRVVRHIDESRRSRGSRSPKEARIVDILKSGFRVRLVALEIAPCEFGAQVVERRWIAALTAFGAELTNTVRSVEVS